MITVSQEYAFCAVLTKTFQATDHRGPRVLAWCPANPSAQSVVIPFDFSLSDKDLHVQALTAFVEKNAHIFDHLPAVVWHAGQTKQGYVFVMERKQ